MRSAALVLVLAALTGCGGSHERSPEQIARAWSAALDRNDNDAAAALFAKGATVVQGASLQLATRADALRWNAELPCGSRVDSVESRGDGRVIVVFTLQGRPRHHCDAPGDRRPCSSRCETGRSCSGTRRRRRPRRAAASSSD